MEPDEIVTSGIEVSQIPTVELSDSMSMPTCEYSVRSGSPTGPPSTFANVGDTVYHVWECKGNDMGMLVKKCFVSDGDGEDHAVVDETGCTSDTYLLTDIKYDDSLMRAHAVSQVFKYADSNQLFFTCQIRLCQKQMGMCDEITVILFELLTFYYLTVSFFEYFKISFVARFSLLIYRHLLLFH